jgi:CAAX prenyl protease-like protein
MTDRRGHGWWPYLLPYVSFLVLVEIGRRVPADLGLAMLVLKPAVPAALLLYFRRRGEYPELGGRAGPPPRPAARAAGVALDVALGVALAVLWMAPYVALPALRPEGQGFDPNLAGEALAPLALGLRLAGYALVTPFFEELFIRSFVMRYAEVYPGPGDFRDVPLARFTWRSFLATVVIFTVGHVPWEWWVAVPWVALTNLWFYWRRSLGAVVLVHGVTNAAILGIALLASGRLHDLNGHALSLWFFV